MKTQSYPDNLITNIFLFDLTMKMNTHTLCFCPLIRKLQAFEILKWAQGSQWRKQRTSNFTCIFTAVNYNFLYNTAFFKYVLYLINIFPYFITLYVINALYYLGS